jgi:hypothetical protein
MLKVEAVGFAVFVYVQFLVLVDEAGGSVRIAHGIVAEE